MTDTESQASAWVPVLQTLARASGHELRNALNGVVVNLEVVRSAASSADPAVRPFIAQAVAQSEESVRLAESTIALLNLIVGAVLNDGRVRCEAAGPRSVRIASTPAEVDRATRLLDPLGTHAAFTADTDGSAVILSIPDTRSETPDA